MESLIPDFAGDRDALKKIVDAPIIVVAHNLETVRRISPRIRDRRASYERSLAVLAAIKELDPTRVTKSSLMLGLGETEEEVIASMRDLHAVGVDVLTLGQYLQPTRRQVPVEAFVPPEKFEDLRREGEKIGFGHVESGPLVRSSHRAHAVFQQLVTNTTADVATGTKARYTLASA